MGRFKPSKKCRKCGEARATSGVYCQRCANAMMLEALTARPGKKEAKRGRDAV